MGKHPVLRPREVVAILEKLGFVELGSAAHTSNIDTRMGGAVPFHGARDISPVLLRQIAKDIGLTVDEMLQNR